MASYDHPNPPGGASTPPANVANFSVGGYASPYHSAAQRPSYPSMHQHPQQGGSPMPVAPPSPHMTSFSQSFTGGPAYPPPQQQQQKQPGNLVQQPRAGSAFYNSTSSTESFSQHQLHPAGLPHSARPPPPPQQHQQHQQPLNSPTATPPRSPSRSMRVSYVDPWNAGSVGTPRTPSGIQTPYGRTQQQPQQFQSPGLRRVTSVPTSARTGNVTSASSSCLAIICPGCKVFSLVTLVSVIQVLVMIIATVSHYFEPTLTFDWYFDRMAIVGNQVIEHSQYYRLLTGLLIHSQWFQLLVNVFMQQQLGNIFIQRFESCLWLQVWFLCGIFGASFGAAAQPTAAFVAVTAANLGPAGFHLSEVLLIAPQLHSADLRRKAMISIIIATSQAFILSWFPKSSPLANVVSFTLGICVGITYHRKGTDLPKWYGKARGFAIFFVLTLFIATITRIVLRKTYGL